MPTTPAGNRSPTITRCSTACAAQNVVAQIPYANLRVLASGWGQRRLDDVQIRLVQHGIQRGMEAGAVGVSTGLDYVNEFYASTDELAETLEAMRPYDGLYVTHVRYKKGLVPAVKEAVEIARRAGVRLHISHLKADAEHVDELMEYVDRTAVNEVDFSFDVYPYMPGSTMLHFLLPNDVWDDGPLAVAAKLTNPDVRRRFDEFLQSYAPDKLDQIRIAWQPSKANAQPSRLFARAVHRRRRAFAGRRALRLAAGRKPGGALRLPRRRRRAHRAVLEARKIHARQRRHFPARRTCASTAIRQHHAPCSAGWCTSAAGSRSKKRCTK